MWQDSSPLCRGGQGWQRAARRDGRVEGAGGTNAPPAGPSGVCAAPAARPGTSRDSVQAVVLPGRHRRPVTSPMTQLGGPVECPSLPPWCTYHDEPSRLIASPVEARPRAPVKAECCRHSLVAGVCRDHRLLLHRLRDQGALSFEESGAALTGPSPVKAPAGVGAVPAGQRLVIRVACRDCQLTPWGYRIRARSLDWCVGPCARLGA